MHGCQVELVLLMVAAAELTSLLKAGKAFLDVRLSVVDFKVLFQSSRFPKHFTALRTFVRVQLSLTG